MWQDGGMVEPWTRERRLERTRSLLLDAAEQVFAERGFISATLDDIAKAAGYSKGAIYKYFATKEELFLAASDRYWRRYFDNFAEVMSSSDHIGASELEDIGERWRQLSRDRGAEHAALGIEFNLYLLRNPEARKRVAAKRSEVVDQLARYIVSGIDNLGATLLIPAATFAHIIIATTDAVELGSHLDDVDMYQAMLEMYVSAVKMP
jgi:AcrR family transcriptional regulator